MNLERCNKGHFYDKDKINDCPYCVETCQKRDELSKEYEKTNTKLFVACDIKPVVGWLVCIAGFEKGKDYRLINERNFIGNLDDVDIFLPSNDQLENKSNFSITYNENQRIFVISPGLSGNIIYLNKKAVYETTILENYSLIEMGEIKLVFIKFCGENFTWKN